MSAKWLPTFADRGCHVISVTDPYGRILGFLDGSRYFSIKAEWTPFQTHYFFFWLCRESNPGLRICSHVIDMFFENCAAQLPDWTASCSREPQYIYIYIYTDWVLDLSTGCARDVWQEVAGQWLQLDDEGMVACRNQLVDSYQILYMFSWQRAGPNIWAATSPG
jgi:hypothetical protein